MNYGELFAFAGVCERWKDPRGNWIRTTTANSVTGAIHDRMPVILNPDDYDLWLDPGFSDVTAVSEMLKRYDALLMRSYLVSTANDDAEFAKPVETEVPPQGQLFA